MVSIYVDSLSELPQGVPSDYEKVELYVSMPVVALSLREHRGELYLFVTDFTEVVNAKFITHNTGWSDAFKGDGDAHVFPLKVNSQLKGLLLKQFPINVPLATTKTFIQLRFEYVMNNGSFYGFLGYSDDIKAVNDLKYFDAGKFNSLCHRIYRFVKPSSLNAIETIIQQMKEDHQKSRKRTLDHLGNLTLFRSAKHPTGRELTFHQEPETQQRYDSIPYASQDQISDQKPPPEISNDSIASEQPQVPQTSNISDSPLRASSYHGSLAYSKPNNSGNRRNGSSPTNNTRVSSNGSLFSNNYDHYLVNKVTVNQLKQLTYEVSKSSNITNHTSSTTFELSGYVKTMMPLDHFIVKPYNRTIKFANLKFYFFESLHASNTDYLEIEFYTDEEICQFLGLKEVEECMIKYESIKLDIEKYTKQKVTIHVSRKVLPTPYPVSYFTCTDTISQCIGRDI